MYELFSPEAKKHIAHQFIKIRNESDTFKAIYRLTIIGVIDDYTVDYNSKTITVIASKKENGYYTKKLKHFLKLYNSEKRTEELINRLSSYYANATNSSSKEIYQCLGLLIKFIWLSVSHTLI